MNSHDVTCFISERKKTSSTTPSSSTSSVHQTTEKARDKSPERLISRASVIVSQVETPRQLTAVLENTAGDTEPRTDANDTRSGFLPFVAYELWGMLTLVGIVSNSSVPPTMCLSESQNGQRCLG